PPTTATADAAYNANYYCSNLIEVKAGDVITFGPVQIKQGYFLTTYDADGNRKIAQVKYADCKKVDTIVTGTEIVQWTVPEGSTSIRMATSQMYFDCTMITVNQPFTTADYFATMEKAGVNVDFLRPTAAKGELTNIFPVSDKVYEGRVDKSNAEIASAAYRTCPAVPVKEGDVIYFGAAAIDQGYHLVLLDKNGNGTTTVNIDYMVQYDLIGNGFTVFAYRMRPGTGYVRVVAATGVYDDGIELATINQPFTAADYLKKFNITLPGQAPAGHELYGKKMLFMGDSISYGSGDAVSPFRTGRAWAGRIADRTGAIVTNASVSGAKASYVNGDDKTKWLYTQFEENKNQQFDIIVMHGGVNDARHNRSIGKILDSEDSAALDKAKNTYVGGLQWLFYNVKKSQPNAKLYFIANHHLDGHTTGNAKNMAPYFDMAKELCEKYGIIFIDLYNNKELNDKLETTTTKYLPDTLHLNAAGYEIITPYILDAIVAGLSVTVEPETTAPETTEAPVETTVAPEVTDEATEEPVIESGVTDVPQDEEKTGCGGMIAGAVAVIALLGTAIVFKKKD
ncbi:MAG: SGNH/GDSL hydrolase family protein, partial [Clostridia bacterium]|nr:SGNH/GDSL hydrolase family protein [Clostridia bacterium]